jgi:hypothetical protein
MTLEFGPGNAVSGSYINRNEGFNCQNTPYPLTGWVLGNFISFSVAWDNVYENCNSVTAWSGFAEADGGSACSASRDFRQVPEILLARWELNPSNLPGRSGTFLLNPAPRRR